MIVVYLSLGVLLVFLLHRSLKWFAHAEPASVRRALRWLAAGALVVVILLLIRFGLSHAAAIVGFLGVAIPLLQKFQRHKGGKDAGHTPHRRQARPMSLEEARHILGLTAAASRKDIQAAHRRMIQKNHPDQGGSEYLASKINEARDVLLDDKGDDA